MPPALIEKCHPPAGAASKFSTASTATGIFVLALVILTLLKAVNMTRAELIKLHDHLVAHYNAHGAEEAREQISALEELLLASIACNPSPVSSPS
jgi:hypothetical protein